MERREHPRIIKRLTTRFSADRDSFFGISSDISENGIFIRTNRGFVPNTPVDIELIMPDNTISYLKGVIRRTIKTPVSSMKNGIGVEIKEKDAKFIHFMKSIMKDIRTSPSEDDSGRDCKKGKNMPIGEKNNVSAEGEDNASKEKEKERRKHKRYMTAESDMNGRMVLADKVQILNISMGGMQLKTDRRLNLDKEYTVTVESRKHIITIKGVVMWSLIKGSRKDSVGNIIPLYIGGIRFTNVPKDKLRDMMESIEKNSTGENASAQICTQDSEFINLSEQFGDVLEILVD